MRVLIKCVGFIGDNLFASSVARKLKEQGIETVDIEISIAQPLELIKLNPYVNNVLFFESVNYSNYDVVYSLQPIHRKETPAVQFQKQCEVLNPTSDYTIYTNPAIDQYVTPLLKQAAGSRILVAYMANWIEKTFRYTEEEYKRGIDVPNLGYGGQRRNIQHILETLERDERICLIPVGMMAGYDQRELTLDGVSNYTLTASILKVCDWFIGAEGGLANLAAGVGTKTVLTGDYVHQLYGWNGVIEKNMDPKLGPKYYFPQGHYTLDPYLTDEQVVHEIKKLIICTA